MAINQQPFLQSYFAVANLANQAKYSLSPVEREHRHVDRDARTTSTPCRRASTPDAADLPRRPGPRLDGGPGRLVCRILL